MVDVNDITRLGKLLEVSATTTDLISREEMAPQLRSRLEAVAHMIEQLAKEITAIAVQMMIERNKSSSDGGGSKKCNNVA